MGRPREESGATRPLPSSGRDDDGRSGVRVREHPVSDHPVAQHPHLARPLRVRPVDGHEDKKGRPIRTIGERWAGGRVGNFGAGISTATLCCFAAAVFAIPTILFMMDLGAGGSYFYFLLENKMGDPGFFGIGLSIVVSVATSAIAFIASILLRSIWVNRKKERLMEEQLSGSSDHPPQEDREESKKEFFEKIKSGLGSFSRLAAMSIGSAFLAFFILVVFVVDLILDIGGVTALLFGKEYLVDIIPPSDERGRIGNLILLMAAVLTPLAEPMLHYVAINFRRLLWIFIRMIDGMWYDDDPNTVLLAANSVDLDGDAEMNISGATATMNGNGHHREVETPY